MVFRKHNWSSVICLIVGFALCIGFPAQCWSGDAASIPTLSVCEALSHASEYDGKMVRIRDRVVGTDEGTWFVGEECPGVFVTQGKVWPSTIAWTMPDSNCAKHSCAPFIRSAVDFKFDWESRKRLEKKWLEIRKRLPDRCIAVTYTGIFEAWSKANSRIPHRDGWIEISGYGHLNGAPAQLVLKSADDVSAVPRCRKKWKTPTQSK